MRRTLRGHKRPKPQSSTNVTYQQIIHRKIGRLLRNMQLETILETVSEDRATSQSARGHQSGEEMSDISEIQD